MVTQRDQLVSAIRAYESSPDKSEFDTAMLRNMMTAAQEEGINWQPDFSFKRAGMSLLDGLAMGLLPGDHALTRGERFAGGIGDVAGLVIPGVGLAKGARVGGRALSSLAGGGGGSAATAVRARAMKSSATSIGKLSAEKGTLLQELALNTSKRGTALKGKGDIVKDLQAKIGKLEGQITKRTDFADRLDTGIERGFERVGNFINSSNAAQNAVRGAAGFGLAGAVRGGVEGAQEGDPFSGAIQGGVSGAMMGAAGGALSPYAWPYVKQHPLIGGLVGASLGGNLASGY